MKLTLTTLALRGTLALGFLGLLSAPTSVMAQTVTVSYTDAFSYFYFGTLDLATGITTEIAPQISYFYTGLAYTPNGTLYGSVFANPYIGLFASVDPTTGTATPITGTPGYIGTNLAANNNTSLVSTILMPGAPSGSLFTSVDSSTGDTTAVGFDTQGYSFNLGNLVYGPNGTLYQLVDNNDFGGSGNGLYSVDPTTGAQTLVFDDPVIDNNVVTGLVTVNNTIYGFASNGATEDIVIIDPTAHTITDTGVTVSDNSLILAAAYVPEPGSITLFGSLAAVVGAGFLRRRRAR